jgi:N-acetylglucosamine malate deacetylase 2
MTKPLTILLSFAHPDDETFLAAGVACRYSANGARLVLITATLGEEGKRGNPPVCTLEELPGIREEELRAAVKILGIDRYHLLGYKDRQLTQAPVQEIREKLVNLIRTYQPELVITFDPNGTNRHPDHIAISRFTIDAVAAAGDSRWFPQSGPPHDVNRLLWSTPVPPWELSRQGSLMYHPGVDSLVDVQPWVSRKIEALKVHRSQHLSIERIFLKQPDVESLLGQEAFRQAYGPALSRRPLDDLLESLR